MSTVFYPASHPAQVFVFNQPLVFYDSFLAGILVAIGLSNDPVLLDHYKIDSKLVVNDFYYSH
ncbi:MAG: hypothetical protein RIR39_235 [Pseudomonadota bacterium]|jgi:hypothetical protein